MTTPATPRPPRVKPPKAMSAEDERYIDEYVTRSVPEKHQLATTRALKGQTMKAASVKMMCLQCSGFQRNEVTECRVITCALHNHRPYQK